MLISLIIITGVLVLLFALKERFDRVSGPLRYTLLVLLVLLVGSLLTMEFLIYAHERIRALLDAIKGIPGVVLAVLYLVFLALSAWAVILVAQVDREGFRHYLHDTFMPKARDTVRGVAVGGWLGWHGLRRGIGRGLRRLFAPPWRDDATSEKDAPDRNGKR